MLRAALGALGAAQVLLGLAQVGRGAADGHLTGGQHLWHESAAWNLAVGAGFVVVALRRSAAASIVPMLTVFVAMLVLLSVNDLLTSAVSMQRLASRAFLLTGYAITLRLSRVEWRGDGPLASQRQTWSRWWTHQHNREQPAPLRLVPAPTQPAGAGTQAPTEPGPPHVARHFHNVRDIRLGRDTGGQMRTAAPGGEQRRAGSQPAEVIVVRPRRLRWISLAAAAVILGLNAFAGVTLSGTTSNGGTLFPADQWAVAGAGAVFAALALVPWRLRVEAEADHIRVRNLLGDHTIPWELVDRVRFDRKALWASLELTNGEPLPLFAVQVIDRDEAVAAVRRLRQLHAVGRAQDPGANEVPAGGPPPPVG